MSIEARIKEHWDANDLRAAATEAIEGYGPEVLGFLISMLRSDERGGEAFSIACEDLWKGLPGFRWRCSFRTWMYTLARHAGARLQRSPHLRHDRNIPLSEISERVRSANVSKTELQDRFSRIRASLSSEDETLLVLRVDKEMSWNDIARVIEGSGDHASKSPTGEIEDAILERSSARLRKRFQLLKDELREQVQGLE